jgi:carbamoyltransferase
LRSPVCSLENIPPGSVLGISFSGAHDSSVSAVDADGRLVSATAYERISRVKQDGRWPVELLKQVPWTNVKYVALSVCERYEPTPEKSAFCTVELSSPLVMDRTHQPAFWEDLRKLDKEIVYVPHHLAHASSAFWASGYEDAICVVYDGGMGNEHWFGGVYAASRAEGVSILDRFSVERYANVAQLYAIVTAVLGFRPVKHEGKLTGLAAHGKVDPRIEAVLQSWLLENERTLALLRWLNIYDRVDPPKLGVYPRERDALKGQLAFASNADIAATLQHIAETHACDIVRRVLKAHPGKRNLCLAGGLFANVRINQRLSELDIDRLFVFPAMGDDGAGAGAAWHALFEREKVAGQPLQHVFLGPRVVEDQDDALRARDIVFSRPADLARAVAERLARGEIVAVTQEEAEFGPRALGHRSILASPRDKDVNSRLNEKLSRTEFMPFAPIVREEDAAEYFRISDKVRDAAKYMTVTVPCTQKAWTECPAVVHIDGTARPQLVSAQTTPFLHRVLSEFSSLAGVGVLVNTSFNIHEEPIVTTADDALRSFFEAGLDHLVVGDCLISREENVAAELRYLHALASRNSQRIKAQNAKLENAAFEIFAHEMKQMEKDILERWVERKKSSTLWKPFSALANLEWGAKGHAQRLSRQLASTLARFKPAG